MDASTPALRTDEPQPLDCPRCAGPRTWVYDMVAGVSRCERCANDPAVILEWTRKNRVTDGTQ